MLGNFYFFQEVNNKTYSDENEQAMREKIFLENVKTINSHNQKYSNNQTRYKKSITKYTDLTPEEFLGINSDSIGEWDVADAEYTNHTYAFKYNKFDWREKGVKFHRRDFILNCTYCHIMTAVN